MSDWKAKRFWKKAEAAETTGGFEILLDGRSVKTPAKTPLVVPTLRMAEAIAVEWDAQIEKVDPLTMPVTRGANAAIDKVATQFDEVVEMLAAYGDSDLLCYRAAAPAELVARQVETWNPLLDWCALTFDARLIPVEGVMHAPQDSRALQKLHAEVAKFDNFGLAAFHDLVGISGSLVLGFAVIKERLTAPEAWAISRLDELWQIEQWGEDEEATSLARQKESDFVSAAKFNDLSLT